MLTIAISFVFGITVVPTLGTMIFRREREGEGQPRPGVAKTGGPDGYETRNDSCRGRRTTACLSLLLPRIQLQFFPGADRNQLVLELKMPAGTHVSATSEAAATMEAELLADQRVRHIATFVGRSTPTFYYNLTGESNSPSFAQLLVTTRTKSEVPTIAELARTVVEQQLPGISFVARDLEQGPPAAAPVAIRLYSEDREALAAGGCGRSLQRCGVTDGTRDVRHDLDLGGLAYTLSVEESVALARGSSVPAVAQTLLSRTRGLPAGEYRGAREPARIVVRSPSGEETPLSELGSTLLFSSRDAAEPTLVGGVGRGELVLRPATIRRENGRQLATLFPSWKRGMGITKYSKTSSPAYRNSFRRAFVTK